MIGRDGFIQGYNAQAAVDRRRQIRSSSPTVSATIPMTTPLSSRWSMRPRPTPAASRSRSPEMPAFVRRRILPSYVTATFAPIGLSASPSGVGRLSKNSRRSEALVFTGRG